MVFEDDRRTVEHRQLCRLKFLVVLYRKSGSDTSRAIDRQVVWEAAGLPDDEGLSAVKYLHAEKCIRCHMGSPLIEITHNGVRDTEAALVGRESDHFILSVVQTFNGNVGVVQTGAHSKATTKS